jgi:hypothetical protein
MGKSPDPGTKMNVTDHISESFETIVWVVNTGTEFFDANPGSF